MTSDWLNDITTWIGAHPVAAGGLIFLVAFCDALAVVGIVVPALPLLFAVGTLIGLGHIDGPYAVLCAAAGAFAGDALSSGWAGAGVLRCASTGCSAATRSSSIAANACSASTAAWAS